MDLAVFERIITFAPRYVKNIVPWCNGSTTDFGSVCSGSNPDGTTKVRVGVASEERCPPAAIPPSCRSVSRSDAFSIVKVNAVADGVLFAVRDALRSISNNGPLSIADKQNIDQ